MHPQKSMMAMTLLASLATACAPPPGPAAGEGALDGSAAGADAAGVSWDGGIVVPDASVPACGHAWSRPLQLGGDGDDSASSIWVHPDGRIFLGGYRNGDLGADNIEPGGNAQGVLLVLSPQGQVERTTLVETPGSDVVESLVGDPAHDRVFIAGRTTGAFPGQTNAGKHDAFVAVVDGEGTLQDATMLGNERPQHPRRLVRAGPNTFLMGGFEDTYVPSNHVESWEDPFVMRLHFEPGGTPAFRQEWLFQFHSPGADFGWDVAGNMDGAVVVGSTLGGTNKGPFVRRLDATGTPTWGKRLEGAGVDAATAVLLSLAGELFVTGASFGTVGDKSFGGQDVFLMKMDAATGNAVWKTQFGGPESDYPLALAMDAQGNLLVGGETLGAILPGHGNQGLTDAFVMRFSPSGAPLDVWEAGTAGEDAILALDVDACGQVVAAGFSSGSLEGAAHQGGRDILLVQVDFTPVR